MEIVRKSDAITKEKESGTKIIYHLFDEYEINVNNVPPHSSQDWHYHKEKEEVILVIDGSIDFEWKEGQEIRIDKLSEGDLVRVENTTHRFVNPYDNSCSFICFKLVLNGNNKRDILSKDKYQEQTNRT